MKPTLPTTVRLLSHTANPIETIYVQWLQSRSTEPVPDPAELARWSATVREAGGTIERIQEIFGVTPMPDGMMRHVSECESTFAKVIEMKVPVVETLDFIFIIENCPVSLREQIVRHRVGHRFGDQMGVDMIPDRVDSTFWSQSMRVIDMGEFADRAQFFIPESVRNSKETITIRGEPIGVEQFYREQMGWIQSAYNRLVRAGVPVEDARNILPLGTQHRFTWKVNLAALFHVLSKRGCWIAQLDMWEPIITGIIEELATKVHPRFRQLIDPPCFDRGRWVGCAFKLDNENRVKGSDPSPPCPLYLHNHCEEASALNSGSGWSGSNVNISIPIDGPVTRSSRWTPPTIEKGVEFSVRGARYRKLWGRDEWTGAPIIKGAAQ